MTKKSTRLIGSIVHGSSAMGEGNKNRGKNAQCIGTNLVTTNDGETAIGKFNKSESGVIFSVGCGTADNNRMNSVQVNSNGDVFIKGFGGFDGKNTEGVTPFRKVLIQFDTLPDAVSSPLGAIVQYTGATNQSGSLKHAGFYQQDDDRWIRIDIPGGYVYADTGSVTGEATIAPGAEQDYTITLSNSGEEEVTGESYVSAKWLDENASEAGTVEIDGNTITLGANDELQDGTVTTLTVTVKTPDGNTFNVTKTITCAVPEDEGGGDSE